MKVITCLFIVLISIAVSQSAYVCCTPSQWEGEAAGVYEDRKRNDTDAFFEYISYDIANQRIRVDFYERIYHQHEIRNVQKTVIEKFIDGEYRVYTIDKSDSNNQRCTWEKKNSALKPLCVSGNHPSSFS